MEIMLSVKDLLPFGVVMRLGILPSLYPVLKGWNYEISKHTLFDDLYFFGILCIYQNVGSTTQLIVFKNQVYMVSLRR
jgi:hypothetical protein